MSDRYIFSGRVEQQLMFRDHRFGVVGEEDAVGATLQSSFELGGGQLELGREGC